MCKTDGASRVKTIGVYKMAVGNRVGVGLTRSTISSLLSSLLQMKEASRLRIHRSEAFVMPTRQHPQLPTDEDGILLKHQLKPMFAV